MSSPPPSGVGWVSPRAVSWTSSWKETASGYGFDSSQVVRVFEHLLGLGHVNTEEAERIATALTLAAKGMDFPDALHLAGSTHCEALFTFDDARFARRARRLESGTPVIVPVSPLASGEKSR